MPNQSHTHRVAANQITTVVLVVAFALMHFIVPLTLALSSQMTRFSWQMFSRQNSVFYFWVVTQDGKMRKFSAGRFLGNVRGDLNVEKAFPPYACQRFPKAVSVRWADVNGKERSYECNR